MTAGAPSRHADVRRSVAGALSLLVPGAGQFYAGAHRRGAALLGLVAAAVAAIGLAVLLHPGGDASVADRRLVAAVLAADALLLGLRLFAVADAWRLPAGRPSRAAGAVLAALVVLAAAPHVAAGWLAVRSQSLLETVFAEREPHDVLPARGVFLTPEPPTAPAPRPQPSKGPPAPPEPPPATGPPLPGSDDVLETGGKLERPWVTILLLGGDSGPGIFSERTDTMIVAALERGTGRAVAFGIPRNLVEVPLGGPAARAMPRFHEPLNALYVWAQRNPSLFPGGRSPGATAMKQTISRLLGLRVDYYAHVNLNGFVTLVDALGGVTIHVKERLVDEVTRPAWGETKPRIDVYPGRTYHFSGRTSLAYVRSRKASNDYRRMARQRCFLAAMAQQMDVVRVLRHFGAIASTFEDNVTTDIPLGRLPDLLRLVHRLDTRRTVTVTFGRRFIARRRAADRYPLPNVGLIRRVARETILDPRPRDSEDVSTIAKSC